MLGQAGPEIKKCDDFWGTVAFPCTGSGIRNATDSGVCISEPGMRGYVSSVASPRTGSDEPIGKSKKVIPTLNCNTSDVECGFEAECVGHLHRRVALQRKRGPVCPPLPGVR